ncbi:MAG: arylsulfatase, partial [Paraburkholderia sp.]|nr:arylsulfatase [Paraburkholderia sp.]
MTRLPRSKLLATWGSLLALGGVCAALIVAPPTLAPAQTKPPQAQKAPAQPAQNTSKPNILVIFGDDIGIGNVSAYTQGL